jgi:tight adherence protein C
VLYLIAAGVALAVGLMVMGLASLLPAQGRPSRSRLVDLGLDEAFAKDAAFRRSRTRARVKDLLAYLGGRMESPKRDWSPTRTRLVHAGFRHPSALPVFLGGRLAAAALLYFYGVFVGLGWGATGAGAIYLGLVGAALGWVVPNFLLSVRVTRRQKGIQKLLPDVVDLLVICVEAGLALNQAFQRVAQELRHAGDVLPTEIAQMNLEIRAGTPRDQALTALGERTGVADVRSLVSMLIQTERFGTSIADSLRVHAESIRVARQQRAEEEAAKTTIKMVFPLALCIFPALLVVILGPAMIQIMAVFSNLAE